MQLTSRLPALAQRPGLAATGRAALWLALCGVCGLATGLLTLQALAWHAYKHDDTLGHLERARVLDPENARYAKALGDQWMFEAPYQPFLAADDYRDAVGLSPFDALYWLDWGRVNVRLGHPEPARRAFTMAATLDANNRIVNAFIGNIYWEEGQREQAVRYHARAIALNPAYARDIYQRYLDAGLSPVKTATDLLGGSPELWRQYFFEVLAKAEPEIARQLWAALPASAKRVAEKPMSDLYRRYFDYLVSKQAYPLARELWRQIAQDFYQRQWDEQAERLWNGDLSLAPAFPGGMEWRIEGPWPKGVQAAIKPAGGPGGHHSLWLTFDGKENVTLSSVLHAFAVEPGRSYHFQCKAQSFDITTDNGPYLVLALEGKPPVRLKSQVLTGTGNGDISLDLAVPAGAAWAELRINRDRSGKLNNKIKGMVEFTDFELTDQTAGVAGNQAP